MNPFLEAVAASLLFPFNKKFPGQTRQSVQTIGEIREAPDKAHSETPFRAGHRRWLVALTLVTGLVAGEMATAVSAAAAPPPCTDFQLVTEWGTVKSEIRPRDGDPIGYYTWWWFINDLGHRPGKYDWQMFVNGDPISATQSANKDDMLHFGQPRYSSGKNLWNSGDIIHVDAFHKTQDSKFYITPLNQCTVP